MQPLDLKLANGTRLTGRYYFPPKESATTNHKPLIVALHGGTLTSGYYDLNEEYSVATFAELYATPFIAIDRPCYRETTSILPLQDSETFFQKTAEQLHTFILPCLWETFGVPKGCAGVVTVNHSMAVPIAIITAALHADTAKPPYPLLGIVITGFGSQWANPEELRAPAGVQLPPQMEYDPFVKKLLMLSADKYSAYEPDVLPFLDSEKFPMPLEELLDLQKHWPTYAAARAAQVAVPINYALGEHDFLWEADQKSLDQFKAMFLNCPRIDATVIAGAPHAIEWSKSRKEWHQKYLSWALDLSSLAKS